MDGKTASRIVGITYGQLNLWVNQIDGLLSNESVSQGLPRNFTYRDLVLLGIVKDLRQEGLKTGAIRQAIKVISEYWSKYWKDDDPENAGWLLTDDNKSFDWIGGDRPGIIFEGDSDIVSGFLADLIKSNKKYQQEGLLVKYEKSDDDQNVRVYVRLSSYFYDLRRVAYEIQEKMPVLTTSE